MDDSTEFRFDGWTLVRASGELLRDGHRIRLQDHPFQVLDALLVQPGALVTREQLIARLWPNQVVEYDMALNAAVRRLRAALGDDADTPRYVETVPRRGYRFIGQLETQSPSPPAAEPAADVPRKTAPRQVLLGYGAAATLLAVLVGGWLWLRDRTAADVEPQAPTARKSIVVLPFTNLSSNETDGLFADGLTEELINQLSRKGGLRVIARTSSFALRDQSLDIQAVARRLGVSHALEGSVRRSGDHVRVTAQLIDTADSSHLWSQNYDRNMGDLFAVQDDIAAHVAAALEVRLDPSATAGHRPEPAAYEKYLVARFLFGRRGPGDVALARNYFEQATAIDPEFAPAWAGLSSSYFILVVTGEMDRSPGLARLEESANRALSLDPRLAEPHVRLAQAAYGMGDQDAIQEHWRRAMELDPESPLVKPMLARRQAADRGAMLDDIALARILVETDPLSVVARDNLGWAYYAAGQFDSALVEARKALELSPATSPVLACNSLIQLGRFSEARTLGEDTPDRAGRLLCLALAEQGLGDRAKADAALAELSASFPDTSAFRIAEVQAYRGDYGSAFDWLQRNRAYCAKAGSAPWRYECTGEEAEASPYLAPLRSDPRWASLSRAG